MGRTSDERASSPWNPDVYDRFAAEREAPFQDLLAMIEPGARTVLDLGCGTGRLTALLNAAVGATATLGVDSSETMLAEAERRAAPGLRFLRADLASFAPDVPADLVFSNAALHWLPDHPAVFARVAAMVAPGGQLAVQMPANHSEPPHRIAARLARESPFAEALGGWTRVSPVLDPQDYSVLLDGLGFRPPRVRLEVYAHRLANRDAVVDWVRGTLLTAYERRLPPDLFAAFLDRYAERVRAEIPDRRPFFFPFKRILLWGRR